MKAVKIALLAAAGLLPALGFAAEVSYSDNYWSYSTTNTALDIAKFDPAMGTLQSVAFAFTVDVTSSFVSLTAKESTTATAGLSYNLMSANTTGLATQDLKTLLENSTEVTGLMNGSDFNQSQVLTSNGALATFGLGASSNSVTISSADTGLLAQLTLGSAGGNLYSINFNDLFTASLAQGGVELTQGGGLLIVKSTPDAHYSVTATYTFIPEPSTYALIFGAFTLVIVGYRRFRK